MITLTIIMHCSAAWRTYSALVISDSLLNPGLRAFGNDVYNLASPSVHRNFNQASLT
jgi:hypothetical protein